MSTVIIRNLPYTKNEDVTSKVNGLITDGLKIRNVTVIGAERKESRFDSRPGVVVAKFRNNDDKRTVMQGKRTLKHHKTFSNVYINHDQTIEERRVAASMRTLADAVRRGDKDVHVSGTRVYTSTDRNDRRDKNTVNGSEQSSNNSYNRPNRQVSESDNRQVRGNQDKRRENCDDQRRRQNRDYHENQSRHASQNTRDYRQKYRD
jgi:hypothetical protein